METVEKDPWLEASEVAKELGLEPRYFSEKFIFNTADFPPATRLTPTGRRRWRKSEITKFLETRKEKLAC